MLRGPSMLRGIVSKSMVKAQPMAITVEEGQALDAAQRSNSALYTFALFLRISFFIAVVAKALSLWHG